MNKLIVSGIPTLDGEYEFEDFTTFTNRELHRIKKLTGLRLGEFQEAFASMDNDVLVGLSVVVLERQGKDVDDEQLWDAPAGSLVFDFEATEDPTEGLTQTSESNEDELTASEPPDSGSDSRTSSENPENGQKVTGLPVLPRSVISDPETLAS